MTTLREAAQQALEALEHYRSGEDYQPTPASDVITKLRSALAQPEPEPAAWLLEAYDINEHKTLKRLVFERPNVNPGIRITPYYTHPPKRKPLTDEEIARIMQPFEAVEPEHPFWVDVARAIERAHGIGEKV